MITYGSTTLTSYNSITSTKVYYYKSSSATALSGGSWSTTKPTWENGKYIWQKIRTLYEDGTYTESDPVNITGQQGATGAAAYSYKLNASDTIIGKTKTGEYTVNKTTFSATSKQGTSAVTAYSGRFKIETTEDGSTWTTSYTSSANESSKEFTIPENIVAVKCSLYQAGGVTVLLDIVTIPVVKDGVDAIGLKDSIPIYLASDKATGVTKLDLGWTRYRPELTAEKKYLWVYYISRFSEGDTDPELIEIKDDIVSFENHGDVSPVESCIVDINPIQEINESEEINPINGWNNITATRTGKNLLKLPEYEEIITYEIQASYYKIPIKLFPNTDYYLYTEYLNDYTSKGKSNCYVLMTSDPNGNSNWKAIGHSSSGIVNGTMKSTLDGYLFLKIYSGCSQEIYDELKNNCKAMLSFGTTPVTYEPYQRTDYQCSVESEENKNLVIYDKEPYLFRKSKSSQIKFLEENIVGGTVCWNQFVQNGDFSDDTNNWQVYPSSGGTLTVTNNIVTFAMNQTSSAKAVMQQVNKIPVDHVVLWGCDVKTTTDNAKTAVFIYYNSSKSVASNINTRLWLASSVIGYDDTWHNRSIITRNADANAQYILVGTASGTTATNVTVEFKNVQLFDLTQMFGTEIANYILELEQSEEGAGVAWFKKYFPYSFYDYNAGEMLSVEGITQKKIIGKNLLPMNIQTGSYKYNMTISINSDKSFYVNKPNGTGWGEAEISRIFLYAGTYTLIEEDDSSQNAEIACYNENDILVTDTRYSKIRVFDIPQNGYYTFKYWRSAAATNVLTKMSLLYGDMSLSDYLYESYYENIYPLDSSLTLKGIPKLDDNKNLYFDGDIYKPDGTVERRYGIVDLGTLAWSVQTAETGVFKSSALSDLTIKVGNSIIANIICDRFISSPAASPMPNNAISISSTGILYVKDSEYANVSAANFKAAMSGVYLVYELAEPTTEQAQSYASSQLIDDWSTEEYITDSIVPVGHETNYYNNTVYGGQYNITTGELTVTYDVVDLGTLTYSTRYIGTNNKVLSTELPFNPESGLSLIAENYAIIDSVAGAAALSPPDDHDRGIYRYGSQNSKTIYIICGVKDNLKGKLVYKIAEPKNYSLIPQEVTALTGQNHVYADSGEVTIDYYDNQKATEPYVDYATTTALEASINAFSNALGTLEAPYTELEWVESTGKQYVYLDWKPPIKTWGFEADFICRNLIGSTGGNVWNEETNANGYGTIFGTRNASAVNDCMLTSYATGYIKIGGGSISDIGFERNKRIVMKMHGTTFTKPDGTTKTLTRLNETANKPYWNMTVFAYHQGLRQASYGGVTEPSSTRIYSLKFFDGDTLTVDLVGAIRKSDRITGLYDKVSKHFYPAPGLLYGNEVGDIGEIASIKQSMLKTNPQTIVVNKNRTRMWEATVPFDHLEDGQKLTVTYSYGNVVNSIETEKLAGWTDTSSNQQVYLKLTLSNGDQTDWIPCYYSNTGRLTTHYGSGIPIIFTYRENMLAGASETSSGYAIMRGFYADANYDSNTIYTQYASAVKAGTNGVKRYTLIMRDSDNTYSSFINQANTLGTTKTAYTGGFVLGKIYYSSGGAEYATGANTSSIWSTYQVDLRYDFNITTSGATALTLYKPVYLVGTVHDDDGLFYLDTTQWWTQTEPTSEDGKVYVFIGQAYSAYQSWLAVDNTAYQYYDGKFMPYETVRTLKSITTLQETLENQIDGKVETWCQINDPATAWTTADLKNQHDGDLWYYIGESNTTYKNNTTYKYTASTGKWTAYSASTDLFDRIDSKSTVYYGKPSAITQNLEVGDYLVDNTDGCSYRWDGSKWVKLTDYKTAIDNIEIGGRNYYRSVVSVDPIIWGDISYTYNKENGEYHITVNTANSSFKQIHCREAVSNIDDLKGKTVIFSVSEMSSSNVSAEMRIYAYSYTDSTPKTLSTLTSTKMTDSFVVPDTITKLGYIIRCDQNTNEAVDDTFIFRGIKLEIGNKATDWSPAPEDVETAISNVQDTANTALNQSVEYIVGTQTAATGSWKGVTTESELRDGKTIMYKLPFAGSGNASLQLTLSDGSLTENIPVYMIHSTSSNNGTLARVTTHYPAGSVIQMTYDSNANYWKTTGYNSNINYYDRSLYAVSLAASTAIAAVRIAVLGTDGKLHILNTTAFDIKCPPLYVSTAYSTSDVTKATKRSTNYSYWGSAFALTSTHAVAGAVAGKPVYIVGTLEEDTFTPTTTVLTCTEPTSEDNLVYMRLGRMTTTANAVLEAEHPFYTYYDGAFRLLSEAEEMKAAKSATNYMSSDNTGIMVADMTDGVEKLPSDTTLTGSNVFITAGYGSGNTAVPAGVHIRDGRTDIARFGATAQIGRDDEGHVLIDSDSVDIKNGQDVLASFGENTHIGGENNAKIQINGIAIGGIDEQGAQTFEISNNGTTQEMGYIVNNIFQSMDFTKSSPSTPAILTYTIPQLIKNGSAITISFRCFNVYQSGLAFTYGTTSTSTINTSYVGGSITYDGENTFVFSVYRKLSANDTYIFTLERITFNGTRKAPYFTFGTRKSNSSIGSFSFAEGAENGALGKYSHSEGFATIASKNASHAEGGSTYASGDYSHAEGYFAQATGRCAHAQNEGTRAEGDCQTTLGKYNIPDPQNVYAVIIGNGEDGTYTHTWVDDQGETHEEEVDKTSNALAITWDGNVEMALNTIATTGTIDNDLYTAITALGWEGDVIV